MHPSIHYFTLNVHSMYQEGLVIESINKQIILSLAAFCFPYLDINTINFGLLDLCKALDVVADGEYEAYSV